MNRHERRAAAAKERREKGVGELLDALPPPLGMLGAIASPSIDSVPAATETEPVLLPAGASPGVPPSCFDLEPTTQPGPLPRELPALRFEGRTLELRVLVNTDEDLAEVLERVRLAAAGPRARMTVAGAVLVDEDLAERWTRLWAHAVPPAPEASTMHVFDPALLKIGFTLEPRASAEWYFQPPSGSAFRCQGIVLDAQPGVPLLGALRLTVDGPRGWVEDVWIERMMVGQESQLAEPERGVPLEPFVVAPMQMRWRAATYEDRILLRFRNTSDRPVPLALRLRGEGHSPSGGVETFR